MSKYIHHKLRLWWMYLIRSRFAGHLVSMEVAEISQVTNGDFIAHQRVNSYWSKYGSLHDEALDVPILLLHPSNVVVNLPFGHQCNFFWPSWFLPVSWHSFLLCTPLRSGGHRYWRTLKALLCAWPSFAEISLLEVPEFSQELMLALFKSGRKMNTEVVATLTNNTGQVNIDESSISVRNNMVLSVPCILWFNFHCPQRIFMLSVMTDKGWCS